MLNIRSNSGHTGIIFVMSEIAVEAASAKIKLLEVAKQAAVLAAGLQNAAPGDKSTPNASIQYLIATADALTAIADECEELAHPTSISAADDTTGRPGI